MKSIIDLKFYIENSRHSHDHVLKEKVEKVWKDCAKLNSHLQFTSDKVNDPVLQRLLIAKENYKLLKNLDNGT